METLIISNKGLGNKRNTSGNEHQVKVNQEQILRRVFNCKKKNKSRKEKEIKKKKDGSQRTYKSERKRRNKYTLTT